MTFWELQGEQVVLTFEIPGDTEANTAAKMLAERSSEFEGLATALYQRIEAFRRRIGERRIGKILRGFATNCGGWSREVARYGDCNGQRH